jgi:hypothetical protein
MIMVSCLYVNLLIDSGSESFIVCKQNVKAENWSGHQLFKPKYVFFLTRNNLVFKICLNLSQFLIMRCIIQLAGSDRGGGLRISGFLFLKRFGSAKFMTSLQIPHGLVKSYQGSSRGNNS